MDWLLNFGNRLNSKHDVLLGAGSIDLVPEFSGFLVSGRSPGETLGFWKDYFWIILGDPGAACRDNGIFIGESLQQERESPWALTLTERVPEAFEIPPSDWPEKYFSGQSAKRNSRATLMSSYTRLFSSSNAIVAWPVQLEHFLGELQKK